MSARKCCLGNRSTHVRFEALLAAFWDEHHIDWWKSTHVSGKPAASIIRVGLPQ
jgi:hypothetical protein